MTQATWGSVDFGLTNTDAHTFRSFVKILCGETESRVAEFSFPGVDGCTVTNLGVGGKMIGWQLTVLAETLASFATLETALRAKLNSRPYPMVYHGITRPNVILVKGPPEVTPLQALVACAFDYCKTYELLFRDLTP